MQCHTVYLISMRGNLHFLLLHVGNDVKEEDPLVYMHH